MSVEQVVMYKSSDGTMFVTEKEALQHELKESLWDMPIRSLDAMMS